MLTESWITHIVDAFTTQWLLEVGSPVVFSILLTSSFLSNLKKFPFLQDCQIATLRKLNAKVLLQLKWVVFY